MADISIRSSKISEIKDALSVEIVMADGHDLEAATETIQVRTTVRGPISWSLAAIQQETLSRARDAIAAEIQRMRDAADRLPR